MKKITYEQFEEQYKPIKNPLVEDSPYNGCMFETYGAELVVVREQDFKKIWTLIDSDNDNWYIIPGLHYVDRFGYFICENEWESEDIEVDDNEHITQTEAINHCIKFWEKNGLGLHIEIVKGFYPKEDYTIGEAKYIAKDVYEEITGQDELSFEQQDNIHDHYSSL